MRHDMSFPEVEEEAHGTLTNPWTEFPLSERSGNKNQENSRYKEIIAQQIIA